MPWLPVTAALLVALATAGSTGRVLRALPEPSDPEADAKLPYAALASRRFSWGVGLATFVASAVSFSASPADTWLAWVSLSAVGVLSAAIDLRTTYLPLPLARVGWACAATGVLLTALLRRDPAPLLGAAVGALGLWLFFEVVWRVSGGIGYGDVRLMATVGGVAGAHDPRVILPAALAGTMVGAVWGVVHRLRGGRGLFPYGPALLSGPFVAVAWWSLSP